MSLCSASTGAHIVLQNQTVFNADSGSMVTAPISMWSHQLRATAVPRFVGSEVAWLEEQDNSKGGGFPPSAVLTGFQSFNSS